MGENNYEDTDQWEFLHFDIAEDVRLSNAAGAEGVQRVAYGLEYEEMLSNGYEMPFEFINNQFAYAKRAIPQAKAKAQEE